jgi:hypothetical protein
MRTVEPIFKGAMMEAKKNGWVEVTKDKATGTHTHTHTHCEHTSYVGPATISQPTFFLVSVQGK